MIRQKFRCNKIANDMIKDARGIGQASQLDNGCKKNKHKAGKHGSRY